MGNQEEGAVQAQVRHWLEEGSKAAQRKMINERAEKECAHCLEDKDEAGKPLRLTPCGKSRCRVCKDCYFEYTKTLPPWAQEEAEAPVTDVNLDEPATGSASPVSTSEEAHANDEADVAVDHVDEGAHRQHADEEEGGFQWQAELDGLTAMGFSPESARPLLVLTQGNAEACADMLLVTAE